MPKVSARPLGRPRSRPSVVLHPELLKAFSNATPSVQVVAIAALVSVFKQFDRLDVGYFLTTKGQRVAWPRQVAGGAR